MRSDVAGLEKAVENDWQERLLYEQQQSRSEQEAMAEIERGRRSRPDLQRVNDVSYSAWTLLLTAAGLAYLFWTTQSGAANKATTSERLQLLLPVAGLALLFLLAAPAAGLLRRMWHERRADADTYNFEFTFRLDEPTRPSLIHAYLSGPSQPVHFDSFGTVTLRRLGGWRIERTSPDATLMKLHSVASVPVSRRRHARFEIVTEVLARKIADNTKFYVRQCRVFGESPRAFDLTRVRLLLRDVLKQLYEPLAEDKDVKIGEVLYLIDLICTGNDDSVAMPGATSTYPNGASAAPAAAAQARQGPGSEGGQSKIIKPRSDQSRRR